MCFCQRTFFFSAKKKKKDNKKTTLLGLIFKPIRLLSLPRSQSASSVVCRGWFPVQQRLSALLRVLFTLYCRAGCSHVSHRLASLSCITLSLAPPSATERSWLHAAFALSLHCLSCSGLLSLLIGFLFNKAERFPPERSKERRRNRGRDAASLQPLSSGSGRTGTGQMTCGGGSPGIYVSPCVEKDPSHREIHAPAFVSLSSCPQHRLQRPVRAAQPRSKRRQRPVPGRR